MKRKITNASCSEFQNSSITPKNHTFNFANLDNLKRAPGSQTEPKRIWTEHILVVWALGQFIRFGNASDLLCSTYIKVSF